MNIQGENTMEQLNGNVQTKQPMGKKVLGVLAFAGGVVFYKLFGVMGVLLFALASALVKKITSTNMPLVLKVILSMASIGLAIGLYFVILVVASVALGRV